MDIRVLALLLFLTHAVLAQQSAPILPDPDLAPAGCSMLQSKIFALKDTPEKCAMYRFRASNAGKLLNLVLQKLIGYDSIVVLAICPKSWSG